ncbi:CGNR zinc finger domain-containing protein [Micromonospora saelicesensis]|uniref:CGNR zinc finger domain-containing protein n=1 Tax=Micromonospora saelicesensis TaxID=285676 RepID=UPI000A532DCA|nr:CGNR zinc finger domain-containing protein [Micromonospora saelicesensis]
MITVGRADSGGRAHAAPFTRALGRSGDTEAAEHALTSAGIMVAGVDGAFYDTSRNGTRRWCSMDGCGARAKAARHCQRQRVTS